MKFKTLLMVAAVAGALQAVPAAAADIPNAISPGIASKMLVRGTLEGVQVVDLRSQRKNDVMVVQAELQSMIDKDVRVYYRFRWLDASGMQVGDGEVWKPLMMLGRQSQFIRSTAPGPQASDFKIEMSAEPR
ncbi:YcfL family protein [Undibacterium luofuense]|uniref:YcfL family protein n=1 Tax=Undibacterium luofuense TaxID=2828733 RepID=A0A941DQN6_9BURK|nr:YcfL family protein [Undibacterium luofuense]MBR7783922.1 YcfL family protein [Undibacterium luofuense]